MILLGFSANLVLNFLNMKTIINKANGYKKEIPEGFSFTTLFFGPCVPLLRGDLKYCLIMILSIILLGAITAGIGAVIFWIVWAFIYNDQYAKSYYENGWVDEKDSSIPEIKTKQEWLDYRKNTGKEAEQDDDE